MNMFVVGFAIRIVLRILMCFELSAPPLPRPSAHLDVQHRDEVRARGLLVHVRGERRAVAPGRREGL